MTPIVRALLIVNVAAFFLLSAQPGLANALVFVPALALVRPWRPRGALREEAPGISAWQRLRRAVS